MKLFKKMIVALVLAGTLANGLEAAKRKPRSVSRRRAAAPAAQAPAAGAAVGVQVAPIVHAPAAAAGVQVAPAVDYGEALYDEVAYGQVPAPAPGYLATTGANLGKFARGIGRFGRGALDLGWRVVCSPVVRSPYDALVALHAHAIKQELISKKEMLAYFIGALICARLTLNGGIILAEEGLKKFFNENPIIPPACVLSSLGLLGTLKTLVYGVLQRFGSTDNFSWGLRVATVVTLVWLLKNLLSQK